MKKNMGSIDKLIRLAIAVLVVILYFTNTISGTTAIVFGIVAALFLLTSLISFCPMYVLLGANTCKTKTKNNNY